MPFVGGGVVLFVRNRFIPCLGRTFLDIGLGPQGVRY